MVKNEKKITKLTKKMYFSENTQDIKEIEKINKLNETKTKLENENRESASKMHEIGNMLVLKSNTLDKLNLKYKNLIK